MWDFILSLFDWLWPEEETDEAEASEEIEDEEDEEDDFEDELVV